jgi:histidyl-tRNA synthetase
MSNKPQLARGTRDFGPLQVVKRKFILNTIEAVFKKYGFMPIETPAMEQLSTLMGKYGNEGDQLLFKILNSGNYFKDLIAYNERALGHEELDKTFLPSFSGKVSDLDEKASLQFISEKGLRYDLTVPFARYVVMNQHEILFPFKRYQMQPVWRADKPQKGRYREFWQCDADVVGSNSLIYETELILIYHEVFTLLGLTDYEIKLNNRKVLAGIANVLGITNRFADFTIVLDKLDKIGTSGVVTEMADKGIVNNSDKLSELLSVFSAKLTNESVMAALDDFGIQSSEQGKLGMQELQQVLSLLNATGVKINLVLEPTLARGLSYYTGCIFEAVSTIGSLKSSIGGGGRYDNLTGIFGLPGISGVGISFGLDRIYDVMDELNLFPKDLKASSSQVLICCFDNDALTYGFSVAAQLRIKNLAAEIYPEAAKMKKQLGYADAKNIPFAIIIGSDEMQSGLLTFKNLVTGAQQRLPLDQIINQLQ